jgi:hypothetical protein
MSKATSPLVNLELAMIRLDAAYRDVVSDSYKLIKERDALLKLTASTTPSNTANAVASKPMSLEAKTPTTTPANTISATASKPMSLEAKAPPTVEDVKIPVFVSPTIQLYGHKTLDQLESHVSCCLFRRRCFRDMADLFSWYLSDHPERRGDVVWCHDIDDLSKKIWNDGETPLLKNHGYIIRFSNK